MKKVCFILYLIVFITLLSWGTCYFAYILLKVMYYLFQYDLFLKIANVIPINIFQLFDNTSKLHINILIFWIFNSLFISISLVSGYVIYKEFDKNSEK